MISSKNQIKYSYREEIISLNSKCSDKLNDILINININRNSIKSLNNLGQSSDNNNTNDNTYHSNQDNYSGYGERREQQIPDIHDEDSQMSNNYRYTQAIMNQNQRPDQQLKIQYVYKRDSQNSKIGKNQQNFNNLDNINNTMKNQTNYMPKEEEMSQNDMNESQNKSNGTTNPEQMDEFKNTTNSININESQVINSNDLNNLNNTKNQQQDQNKEISKSQEMPLLASSRENNNAYSKLIQNYSHFLNNNPVDNYNDFSLNKLNVVPMSAGRYGNIILNNVLYKSQNVDAKSLNNQRFSQISNSSKNNNVAKSEIIINSRKSDTKNVNSRNKIKVLKA